MKKFIWLWVAAALILACGGLTPTASPPEPTPAPDQTQVVNPTQPPNGATPAPVTPAPTTESVTLALDSVTEPNTHPRLWLTPASVERYRAWAVDSNPAWSEGLALLAERAKAEMDEGRVPDQDCGNIGYEEYPTETYAELFAFLANVDPDPTRRADYADRAHTLLMFMMNEAAKGPATEENVVCNESQQYPPFRHPDFFTSDRDRARYHGEAFALTVDWIYPSLTATDKATIRQVFLQWSEDIVTRGYHHPEPVGLLNDPQLLADPQQVRFAGNNYYAAHMRNLGLMALAFDEADDPDGRLRAYLDTATGAYLYILNHLLQTESQGGLLPEGLEYSPQTASYVAQFLWALQTANTPQATQSVDLSFWNDFITSYLHSLSPTSITQDVGGELMSVYQPAWYGDAQDYRLPDYINAFGSLNHVLANSNQREAVRWIVTHTAPGGAERLNERVRNPTDFRESLLYFMTLDPTAAPARDPRPSLPTEYFAAGLDRFFSRTDWGPTATWFNYRLSWNSIDHQMADGNHFEFYRNGEWLTKSRTGYADIAEGIASSEFYNTLAIKNTRPAERDDSDWRIDLWLRGSQWNYVNAGDPTLIAYSFNDSFAYAAGDATHLYNSPSEGVTEVVEASRSIVWLKPDFIVVYDRAETKSDGLFKRWWLQLAQPATVTGQQAVSLTSGGQQLIVTALLPLDAQLQAVNTADPHVEDTVANDEPMTVRLMTEAPGAPRSTRFLHILQGADDGADPAVTTLIQSEDGAWQGAAVNGTVVLFTQALQQTLTTLAYTAPTDTRLHLITGLTPGAGYAVTVETVGDGLKVTVQPGTQFTADAGGVLMVK